MCYVKGFRVNIILCCSGEDVKIMICCRSKGERHAMLQW